MLTIHVLLKISNNDSANICSWFVDSKLSIPFGEEETKSILTKSNIKKPNIKYQNVEIKQRSQVFYLGCVMDETMSGDPMDLKVISKLNTKLEFFYR